MPSLENSHLLRHRLENQGTSSCQGFTLVELLIAMTLVGMILVILFAGLHLSSRSWEAAEKRTQSVEKFRIIDSFFRRQVRGLKLLSYNDPNRGSTLAFSGAPNGVRFVVPLLTRLGLGGLYWVTFEVVNQGGQSRLMMSWQPYRPDKQPAGSPEQEVLLKGMKEMAFSYFGSEVLGGRPEWHDHWADLRLPPQLIRLSIRAQDDQWPQQLIARIHVDPQSNQRNFLDFGP